MSRSFGQLARAQWRAGTQMAAQLAPHLPVAAPLIAKPAKRPVKVPARTPHAAPKGPGDWLTGYAAAVGGVRRFHVYRPSGVSWSERLPMVVMLHGCGQDARSFASSTRMNRLADKERFIVLYPEQDRRFNAGGCWNWYETRSGLALGEVAILMAAVQQACLLYPVDPSRVAVAGLSAGASMAALLATRHPDTFKAVAMHSGVPPGLATNSANAFGAMRGRRAPGAVTPSPRVDASARPWPPLIVIHGHADTVVSARNAETTAQLWADASGAHATAPRSVQRGKRHPMTVTDYKRGGRTVASLCEIGRLGHAWSGGAARAAHSDAHGPDASRLVWSFVSKQFSQVV